MKTKATPKTVHVYSSMPIEVPCSVIRTSLRHGSHRRPSYRWAQGFSEVYPEGKISAPLRLRNWQAMARRDGTKLKVHHTEDAARKAAGC